MNARFHGARAHAAAVLVSLLAIGAVANAQCIGMAPTFTLPMAYTPSPSFSVVAIDRGDLDGDGDLDLVACGGGQLVVLRNQVAGVYSVDPPIPVGITNARSIAIGDFDEDGLPDVAITGGSVIVTTATNLQGYVVVLLNRSTAASAAVTFLPPVLIPFGVFAPWGSVGRDIAAADLDADGILDLAVADSNSMNAWVLLGQGALGVGDGSFGTPMPFGVGTTLHTSVAVADFDQDGAKDLAIAHYGGSASPTVVKLLAGVVGPSGPTGAFAPAGTVTLPGPSAALAIEACDLNGDGILDLAVANYNKIDVAYGGGGFAFVATSYPAGIYPEGLAVGDFSGDGLVDIAASRNAPIGSGNGNFAVLVAQAGGFASYTNLTFNPGFPQCITAGDFNGDGILDVAAGRGTGGIDVRWGTCPPVTPGAVTVTHPNGGEILPGGMTAPITWMKSASVPLVDVDVSRDGGATWERIATGEGGTSISWLVAAPGAGNALVHVSASGIPSVSDTSDASFTIVGTGVATVSAVGAGCSPTGLAPSMTAGPPVIGAFMPVTVQGAVPLVPGGLWISNVPAAPTVLAPGCTAYLDLPSIVQVAGFTTDAQGGWGSMFLVQANAQLIGLVGRAQAATVIPGGQVQFTNAAELTLGF